MITSLVVSDPAGVFVSDLTLDKPVGILHGPWQDFRTHLGSLALWIALLVALHSILAFEIRFVVLAKILLLAAPGCS